VAGSAGVGSAAVPLEFGRQCRFREFLREEMEQIDSLEMVDLRGCAFGEMQAW
jgi:hypothetical protein